MKSIVCLGFCFLSMIFAHAQEPVRYKAIHSGVAWFDQNNREVNAHGSCLVKEGDRYYLFGEHHSDTSNAFNGFSCYSSSDLMNWKFERIVLPVQADGLLGPHRVGERVKVMKCPQTGEFVMYMHTDNLKYSDPHVGYATCSTITGEYRFEGELLHEGAYLRKWDLGTFQDADGKGYLLTHEGFIYELASDYKSVRRVVAANVAKGGESPALFRSNGCYFWLFSNKTSWERTDNYYLTALSLEGPWVKRGLFAPEGTLTWNSQCSFVFPMIRDRDTVYMYMGDRWSFPRQGSAATYVWQPITIKGDKMSIPEYCDAWRLGKTIGKQVPVRQKSVRDDGLVERGDWTMEDGMRRSKEKGAMIVFPFHGRQVGVKALSNATSGYARLSIRNKKGVEVLNTIVDFYSLYEYSSQKFVSPILKADDYKLYIEVLGEHPAWQDKRKSDYGSKGYDVCIEDVYLL